MVRWGYKVDDDIKPRRGDTRPKTQEKRWIDVISGRVSLLRSSLYKPGVYPTLRSVVGYASSHTSGGVDFVFLLRASAIEQAHGSQLGVGS